MSDLETLAEAINKIQTRIQNAPKETKSLPDVAGVWINSAYYLAATPEFLSGVAAWFQQVHDTHIKCMARGDGLEAEYVKLLAESDAMKIARLFLGQS